MKDWSALIAANKEKLYKLAEANTEYNSNGDAVISPDDPWFHDDIWDSDFSAAARADCFCGKPQTVL